MKSYYLVLNGHGHVLSLLQELGQSHTSVRVNTLIRFNTYEQYNAKVSSTKNADYRLDNLKTAGSAKCSYVNEDTEYGS